MLLFNTAISRNETDHRMNLKVAILLRTGLVFILIATLSTIAAMEITKNLLLSLGRKYVLEMLERRKDEASEKLLTQLKYALYLAENREIVEWVKNPVNTQPVIKLLKQIKEMTGNIDTFAVSEKERILWYNGVNTDILSREDHDDAWYWDALQSKEYMFNFDYNETLKSTKLWINHPVYVGNEKYGVVGTGVDYDLINSNLTDHFGKHHDTILHDENGIIKIHINPEYIDRTNIFQLYGMDQAVYKRVMKSVKIDSKKIETIFSDNVNTVVSVAWIPLIRWYLVTSISISEYRFEVFYPFLVLQLFSLLILSAILWRILKTLVFNPLEKISLHLKSISGFSSDHPIIMLENNEFAMVAETINTMQTGLHSYAESMNDLVLLRTTELEKANAELNKKTVYIENELNIAKKIQMAMIPDHEQCLAYAGLDIGFKYQAMEALGGDLFDIIRYGKNGYGFYIIDVCGHGVPASLITAMVKVSFNTHAKWGRSSSEIMGRVNREITELLTGTETYVTACYLSINLEEMTYQYSNAGHPPMLIYKNETGALVSEDLSGLFLNVNPDTVYEMKIGSIAVGDCFHLYTDGILEAWNDCGEMYGSRRLKQCIFDNRQSSAQESVEHLFQDVQSFVASEKQEDDQAVLFVKIL